MSQQSEGFLETSHQHTSKVHNICIELMLHIKQSFLDKNGHLWVMIIPSVHQNLGHAWEMFELNNGHSIAKWSKNPIEVWNKHVRSFQSGPAACACQVSVKSNIHDVFKRMLIVSHPRIVTKKIRPTCSICGETGHSSRSSLNKTTDTPETDEKLRINFMYY